MPYSQIDVSLAEHDFDLKFTDRFIGGDKTKRSQFVVGDIETYRF